MSIHRKGRICYLNPWEVADANRGIKPNCRNHRHISKAEAFELSGRPEFGKILSTTFLKEKASSKVVLCGYFVEIAGRIEYVMAKSDPNFSIDEVRRKGLELERNLGIPFIDRKVPLRTRY